MIYIHIPFCRQKCSYCNFHFSTSLSLKDEMLSAMKKELFLRQNELYSKEIRSLYLGGGTPSLLSVDDIKSLIDEVSRYFSFNNDIEITLEANPDDLAASFLKELSTSTVNRLSIGTQSFNDADLRLMNRAHSASEAESSIKRSQDFGFENLSIDLMYGSPVSGMDIWKKNVEKAIAMQVPHISSYALTVEPKTALAHQISKQIIAPPDDALQEEEFLHLCNSLKINGFQHYEISNFAKPGYYSRHNSAYWQHREYLGIGPSAHSYDGCKSRSWNIANNVLYINQLKNNILPKEKEVLSDKDRYNELIMIGLRTQWGVDLQRLEDNFNEEIIHHFRSEIQPKIAAGRLVEEDGFLKIPEEFWFFADGIAADLFLI